MFTFHGNRKLVLFVVSFVAMIAFSGCGGGGPVVIEEGGDEWGSDLPAATFRVGDLGLITHKSADAAIVPDILPVDPMLVDAIQTDATLLDQHGLYSLQVRDGEIKDLLLAIGKKSPYNFVVAPDVEGKVTLDIRDVPLEKLLSSILRDSNCTYRIEDDMIWVKKRVASSELFTFNYIMTARSGTRGMSGSAMDFGGGGDDGNDDDGNNGGNFGGSGAGSVGGDEDIDPFTTVEESLKTFLSETGKVQVNRESGLITIVDYQENIRDVSRFLEKYTTRMQRQVVIEAKLVEVILSKDRQLGIDWHVVLGDSEVNIESRTADQVLQAIFRSKELESVLNALTLRHQVSVKTNPRVTTMHNQPTMITLGEEEVYFEVNEDIDLETGRTIRRTADAESVMVGVSMSVVPHISDEGIITMNVHPTVTEKIGDKVGPDGERTPELTIREVDTVARLKSGDTMMIAGLTMERRGKSQTGVPYLSALPFVGPLLRTDRYETRKVELVIFLTPRIIEP